MAFHVEMTSPLELWSFSNSSRLAKVLDDALYRRQCRQDRYRLLRECSEPCPQATCRRGVCAVSNSTSYTYVRKQGEKRVYACRRRLTTNDSRVRMKRLNLDTLNTYRHDTCASSSPLFQSLRKRISFATRKNSFHSWSRTLWRTSVGENWLRDSPRFCSSRCIARKTTWPRQRRLMNQNSHREELSHSPRRFVWSEVVLAKLVIFTRLYLRTALLSRQWTQVDSG